MPKKVKSVPEIKEDAKADTPSSPRKFQFSYIQMKKVSELFEQKLNKVFWMNLSKADQEAEKETPTNNEYYRLAYTKYNDCPLLNVLRYHPDKSRIPKGKAYSTINLKTCKSTANAQNKIQFNDDEINTIKTTLNLVN